MDSIRRWLGQKAELCSTFYSVGHVHPDTALLISIWLFSKAPAKHMTLFLRSVLQKLSSENILIQ